MCAQHFERAPELDMSVEAVVKGGELLDAFRAMDRDVQLQVVGGMVQGMVYEVMGQACTPEEIGKLLDAIHSGQQHLEQYAFSTRARDEEIERRASQSIEE